MTDEYRRTDSVPLVSIIRVSQEKFGEKTSRSLTEEHVGATRLSVNE